LKRIIARFLSDTTAATAIEYALIGSGIAIVIVASVNGLGTTLGTMFGSVNTSLK
jgi:pilus assembly protein Flp/PilA